MSTNGTAEQTISLLQQQLQAKDAECTALRAALEQIIEKWSHPSWWSENGSWWDSKDCADDLKAALAASHVIPRSAQEQKDQDDTRGHTMEMLGGQELPREGNGR